MSDHTYRVTEIVGSSPDGVDQAIKSLKGESTEKTIQTGFTIVTKDNLSSAEGQAALYKSSC